MTAPLWSDRITTDIFGLCAVITVGRVEFFFRHILAGEPSEAFWILDTPVTQEHWISVMLKNPSDGPHDPLRPVNRVSFVECQRFIDRLNGLRPGLFCSIPTDAQWGAACCSDGRRGPECINEDCWHAGNTNGECPRVRLKAPNRSGVYDMLGGVCEWCDSWLCDVDLSENKGLSTRYSKSQKVLRGTSWNSPVNNFYYGIRGGFTPTNRDSKIGFRIAVVDNFASGQ